MPWSCQQVYETPLRAAATDEEFKLHVAALEWSLADPIIIDRVEDIKSQVNWRERLEPYHHQIQNLFTFCRRLPVLLIADDVGLGKTISAGLILSELRIRRRVKRALVICPSILGPQWLEELDSKFGIKALEARGADLLDKMQSETPVVVTTYDTARDQLHQLQPDAFDMLILDEAHKLRNLHGTKDPPKMAQRIREKLEQRFFKFVLMLTATPLHNRLWDLYSLTDCLTVARGHKNPLGTPEEFRSHFIVPETDGRRLQPSRAQEFRDIMRHYLVRTRRGDAKLAFPSRETQLWRRTATPAEDQLVRLVQQHVASLPALSQISLAQALMSSPWALAAQMENMARKGTLPAAAAVESRRLADGIQETSKLRGLLQFLHNLRAERPKDCRAVVFTSRTETQAGIGRALTCAGFNYGFIQGGQSPQNQETIRRFRTEPPEIQVIVSTDAGAEGINLQVANVLINTEEDEAPAAEDADHP